MKRILALTLKALEWVIPLAGITRLGARRFVSVILAASVHLPPLLGRAFADVPDDRDKPRTILIRGIIMKAMCAAARRPAGFFMRSRSPASKGIDCAFKCVAIKSIGVGRYLHTTPDIRRHRNMKNAVCMIMMILYTGGGIAPAESNEILRIRERYNKTRDLIKSNALYHDQFIINKNNATWPAVGTYQEIYDIYYSLCDERERHNYPYERCVYMIEISSTASVSTSKTEYLFDDQDRLVFIYYKDGYKGTEERYYLSGDKAVRYSVNNTVYDRRIGSHINRSAYENLRRNALRWAGFIKKR